MTEFQQRRSLIGADVEITLNNGEVVKGKLVSVTLGSLWVIADDADIFVKHDQVHQTAVVEPS